MYHPNQQERFCDIIGDILSLNTTDCQKQPLTAVNSHDQLDNKTSLTCLMTFPQIWVESVCDESSDDEDHKSSLHRHSTSSRGMSFSSTDVSFESASHSPASTRHNSLQFTSRESSIEHHCITPDEETAQKFTAIGTSWIERINARGFPINILRKYVDKCDDSDENVTTSETEDDNTWWEEGLTRVFDPYYDISPEDIECIEGKKGADGKPIGQCNVTLKNGDNVFGLFKKGIRQGRGAIEGSNCSNHGLVGLRGFYKDGVLTGEGRAILAPGAWSGVTRLTLEGVFCNGYLEGPVRGIDDRGNLVFIGSYKDGIPSGPCWLATEGQGWLHGIVDSKGRFSGDQVMFLYPDLYNCLVGTFKEEKLVNAKSSKILQAIEDENSILALTPAVPDHDAPILDYCPSNKDNIPCDWLLKDTYESSTVICRTSKIDGAGDGLFAARDLPTNTIVSYYNGLHINPGEVYNTNSFSYQIYVDWKNTDNSPFVDIPNECTNVSVYRASLGHKANHSFVPNCQFVAVEHPRFGRIPALKTILPIKKGQELFSHYKYDIALAPSWYQEAWNRLYDPTNVQDYEEPSGPVTEK